MNFLLVWLFCEEWVIKLPQFIFYGKWQDTPIIFGLKGD